jgi:hypothetical protein
MAQGRRGNKDGAPLTFFGRDRDGGSCQSNMAGAMLLPEDLQRKTLFSHRTAHDHYALQECLRLSEILKDPVIVNSIFLKKNHRIEVLGLVLLISLLIWRLIEHCMRRYIYETGTTITGWKDYPTTKPTSFMLTTKFLSILVLKVENQRRLARSLRPVQLEYLKALGIDPVAFTSP